MSAALPPRIAPLIDVLESDARLDAFRGIRDRELRGSFGLHAIESERVVRRFLTAAVSRRTRPIPPVIEPAALLVTPDSAVRLQDILAEFPTLTVFRCASEAALSAITGYTMHSGAVALGVRHPDCSVTVLAECLARTPTQSREVLIALDDVTQTDNMGAIFRNAASFGARGVVLSPRSSDPFLRKALRVSMGRAVNIPWARAREDEWPMCLDTLRSSYGYTIIAAEDTQNAVNLASFTAPPKSIVVFGAEESGVSRAVLDLADVIVRIPMGDLHGALATDPPSLNVSVASAIMLHGLLSQATTNR